MGAQEFEQTAKGKTAQEAFHNAVDQACYDHGHSGYTGTMAEKCEFVMITPKDGETPMECIDRYSEFEQNPDSPFLDLVIKKNNPYGDKWGPAGCIQTGKDEWIFFGIASS